MPCCGQAAIALPGHGLLGNANQRAQPARAAVKFQYVGKTGLTVVGPVTGMQYRFVGNGAMLPVDVRDQYAVAAVPKLRRVI